MHLAGSTRNAPHRRNVDYLSAFVVYHMRKNGLSAVVNTLYINSKKPVPLFLGNIGKKYLLRNTCIVYENIRTAEFLFSKCCHSVYLAAYGNISLECLSVSAAAIDDTADFGGFFSRAAVIYNNIIPVLTEKNSAGFSYAP